MAKLTFGHRMVKTYKLNRLKNTRLYFTYGLVFFLLILAAACKQQSNNITLIWKGRKATGIRIPQSLVKDISDGLANHPVKIIVSGAKNSAGILGSFTMHDDVVFEPIIPLSPGLKYDILQDDKLIGQIQVPLNTGGRSPRLITIYPEQDTLPENLLKLYLHFSQPMRRAQALDHVYLLNEHKDTMRNVFLNLQPELWDTTGTVLTLWLDPGRIKRGLVLNKKLGNPLKQTESYQLVVSREWKDDEGLRLTENYTKQFTTGIRDEDVPDIDKWKLTIPKAQTGSPLIIDINETLDHYLLQESIRIVTKDGAMVKGTTLVSNKDRTWQFIPDQPWTAQTYRIQVSARLEDLAGNNLNRVFDRDITKDKQARDQGYYDRVFEIKK